MSYFACEIGVGWDVYRTWRWPNMLDEEHVFMAVRLLIDLAPEAVKKALVQVDSPIKNQ